MMQTLPGTRIPRDLDADLAARAETLAAVSAQIEALRQEVQRTNAVIDVAVLMQEAAEYARTKRADADRYAAETRAAAEAAAAEREAAALAAASAATASAEATVAAVYAEGQAAWDALRATYATTRAAVGTAVTQAQQLWADYHQQVEAVHGEVAQVLAAPLPALPAFETLAASVPMVAPAVSQPDPVTSSVAPPVPTADAPAVPRLAPVVPDVPAALDPGPWMPGPAAAQADSPAMPASPLSSATADGEAVLPPLGAADDESPLPPLGAAVPPSLVVRDRPMPHLLESPLEP